MVSLLYLYRIVSLFLRVLEHHGQSTEASKAVSAMHDDLGTRLQLEPHHPHLSSFRF